MGKAANWKVLRIQEIGLFHERFRPTRAGDRQYWKSPSGNSGKHPADAESGADYRFAMKSTASNPNAATEHQKKDSRQNTTSPSQQQPVNTAASASEKATARARQGEPLPADKKSDRSPK